MIDRENVTVVVFLALLAALVLATTAGVIVGRDVHLAVTVEDRDPVLPAPLDSPRFLLANELDAVQVGATRAEVLEAFGGPWAAVRRREKEGFEFWYYDAARDPSGGEILLEVVVERATGKVVAIERLAAQPR